MKKIPNFKSQISNFGFTLIELLVVISIIGILATLMISRYGMAEKSARDAERKSDLNQYRIALENLGSQTGGTYPQRTSAGPASNPSAEPCDSLEDGDYISVCPMDPRQEEVDTCGEYCYWYLSDGLNYILYTKTETGSGSISNYWYLCSDGRAGEKADSGAPNAGDCGF